jgi:CO/xanthine dehydrogenase Mo-binding subunit
MTDSQIGRKMLRREDRRFLTGEARYLDDMAFPAVLYVQFVRSPHAHARIVQIDAESARAMPGVVAVVSGHDFARWTKPLRMAPPIEGLNPVIVESFPTAKVRFDGDLVACVVAETATQAADAAEQVVVEYETLPPVVDSTAALHPGAALVDEALTNNLIAHQSFSAGDPERRFGTAFRVVDASFSQHRQTHVPLETRGCCAVWDAGHEHLTFHVGNQAPHPYRTQLAARLDRNRRSRSSARISGAPLGRRSPCIARNSPLPPWPAYCAARFAGAKAAVKTCWPPVMRANSRSIRVPPSMPKGVSAPYPCRFSKISALTASFRQTISPA